MKKTGTVIVALAVILFSTTYVRAASAERRVKSAQQYLLDDKLLAAEKELGKALKADPNYAPAHDLAGLIAEAKGDDDAAEASYKKALECDARCYEARLHLGELYTAADRLDEAVRELETLIKARPKMAEAYAAIGRARILQEEYKKAERVLCDGKKNAGDTAEIEFLLGNAYLGLGQSKYRNAIKAFQESIRLDSEFVDAYVALADVYMEEGKYSKAAEKLVEALRHDPGHPEANYLFGRLAVLRKQYPRAMLAFKKTLETDPENVDAHREIGLLYQDYRKDFAKAVFHYNKYKSLGGDDKRVDDWLKSAIEGKTSGTSDEELSGEEDEGGESGKEEKSGEEKSKDAPQK